MMKITMVSIANYCSSVTLWPMLNITTTTTTTIAITTITITTTIDDNRLNWRLLLLCPALLLALLWLLAGL